MRFYRPIYFVMSGCKLLNDEGGALSQDELMKLWGLYNMMAGSTLSTFILRGESDDNLRSQYGTDTQNPTLLAKYLFMVGEKGRLCWNNKEFLNPDDITPENFRKICKALKRYINEGCRGNTGRSFIMRNFHDRNIDFCSALENTDDIEAKYSKLKSKERRAVNLYYLAIAHTINSYGYKKASSFVSATTNADVAQVFTDDVCIYGWVPKEPTGVNRREYRTIDYVVTENEAVVKQSGMPYWDTPVYPEQKEVTLRCGFLPHFIIGFNVKNCFYVNPAVFSSMDKLQDKKTFKEWFQYKSRLLRYGLEVDQTNFKEFLRLTNFRRYYTFDGAKYEVYCLY